MMGIAVSKWISFGVLCLTSLLVLGSQTSLFKSNACVLIIKCKPNGAGWVPMLAWKLSADHKKKRSKTNVWCSEFLHMLRYIKYNVWPREIV